MSVPKKRRSFTGECMQCGSILCEGAGCRIHDPMPPLQQLKLLDGWLERNVRAAKKSARRMQAALSETPNERVIYDDRGKLDEVFVSGSAHLERMDRNRWFLSMTREDGTSTAIWFEGKVTLTEERG